MCIDKLSTRLSRQISSSFSNCERKRYALHTHRARQPLSARFRNEGDHRSGVSCMPRYHVRPSVRELPRPALAVNPPTLRELPGLALTHGALSWKLERSRSLVATQCGTTATYGSCQSHTQQVRALLICVPPSLQTNTERRCDFVALSHEPLAFRPIITLGRGHCHF